MDKIRNAIEKHLAYRRRHGFTTENAWSAQYGDVWVVRDAATLTPVELVTAGDGRAYLLRLCQDGLNRYSYVPGLFDYVLDGSRLA